MALGILKTKARTEAEDVTRQTEKTRAEIAAYREAEDELSARTRQVLAAITSFAFGIGTLGYLLHLVAAGPRRAGVIPIDTAAAIDSFQAIADLAAREGLALIIGLLAAESALAIAAATFGPNAIAGPASAIAAQRWISTVGISVATLAALSCVITMGAAFGAAEHEKAVLGSLLPMIVLSVLSCGLATAIGHRGDIIARQIAIGLSLARAEDARRRLVGVPAKSGFPLLTVAITPVALTLGIADIGILVEYGWSPALQRAGALALLVAWLALCMYSTRGLLRTQAVTWARARSWASARLVIGYATFLVVAAIMWAPLALIAPWRFTTSDLMIAVIYASTAAPIIALLGYGCPRIRGRGGRGSQARSLTWTPSPATASAARRRLDRSVTILKSELASAMSTEPRS